MPRPSIPPLEIRLLLAVLALAAVAVLGPCISQAAAYHAFADQGTRWGVPHAADVLSNLPFALGGIACLAMLAACDRTALSATERALVALTGAGLLATAAGSTWYHLRPDDAGLAIDRLAMVGPFAGLLGLAACRISSRAGASLATLVLTAGPVGIAVWLASGNLLPWAVLQAGGMLLLVALAALRNDAALTVRWSLLIAAYALSKLCELGDAAVWHWSEELISGHSLKHVVAALAVLPLLQALHRVRTSGQNPVQLPAGAA